QSELRLGKLYSGNVNLLAVSFSLQAVQSFNLPNQGSQAHNDKHKHKVDKELNKLMPSGNPTTCRPVDKSCK
uniref:hypothetical protein n=1 Tax=Candidatus Chordibacter forsetii TaxID=3381758 RepID=UPI00389A2595